MTLTPISSHDKHYLTLTSGDLFYVFELPFRKTPPIILNLLLSVAVSLT